MEDFIKNEVLPLLILVPLFVGMAYILADSVDGDARNLHSTGEDCNAANIR